MLVVLVVRLQQFVPPSEGRSVVSNKVHVVEVMEAGAGIERDQVERVHGDVITTEREQTYSVSDELKELISFFMICLRC